MVRVRLHQRDVLVGRVRLDPGNVCRSRVLEASALVELDRPIAPSATCVDPSTSSGACSLVHRVDVGAQRARELLGSVPEQRDRPAGRERVGGPVVRDCGIEPVPGLRGVHERVSRRSGSSPRTWSRRSMPLARATAAMPASARARALSSPRFAKPGVAMPVPDADLERAVARVATRRTRPPRRTARRDSPAGAGRTSRRPRRRRCAARASRSVASASSKMRAVQPAISTGGSSSVTMRSAIASNAPAAARVGRVEHDRLAVVATFRHRGLDRDRRRRAARP